MKVICTSCTASEVWELDGLIAEVRANGGNSDWSAARNSLRCPKRCASTMITLLPIPAISGMSDWEHFGKAAVCLASRAPWTVSRPDHAFQSGRL